MTGTVAQVEQRTEHWRDPLARVGLVAKGALYVILGILAIQFAQGKTSSDSVSQTGALERVAEQPLGRFLLVALTIGLLCLTAWHAIQAFAGDPIEGEEATDRVKFAGKAVVYGVLTVTAAKITIDNWNGGGSSTGNQSGDAPSQKAASTLFDLPGGTLLVVALGLVLIGIAIYQVVQYVVRTEHMDRIAGSGRASGLLKTIGRVGYAARALVLAICGVFFLVAAAQHDPNESKGISGALQTMSEQGWGRAVLWFVAIGFALFGVFCFAEAKLRPDT
jgi:hypothetical protein